MSRKFTGISFSLYRHVGLVGVPVGGLSGPDVGKYRPEYVRALAFLPNWPAPHAPSPAHGREQNGRFLVLDVYQGLDGVGRGEIKRLRVVEETSRVSEVPPGGRWWNQAFLNSWQGAYVVKNFLGTVTVSI